MNAQAKQLKDYVVDLAALITGKRGQSAGGHQAIKAVPTQPEYSRPGNKKMIGHPSKEVRPDQVIPFDDDFKDF